MKKIIIVVVVILFNLTASSQLTAKKENSTIIGQYAKFGTIYAELGAKTTDSNTSYYLSYRNLKYSYITDIQTINFEGDDNIVNQLYNVLNSLISSKETQANFALGNEDMTVSKINIMGINSLKIYTEFGFFYLTKKQLDKLFNKIKG
jgi:hypothetical protein